MDFKSGFHSEIGVERSAEILVELQGRHAFDFADHYATTLAAAGSYASAENWRAIARAIETLLTKSKGQSSSTR